MRDRAASVFENLGRLIEEGWDYEAVYAFETSRLGHGDWGTLTTTLNGTYISRIILQAARAFQNEGRLPANVDNVELDRVRSCSLLLPDSADWVSESPPA